MDIKRAKELLLKWSTKFLKNVVFVDGKLPLFVLESAIDYCVQEEDYELAALFKKLIDIGYYKDSNGTEGEMLYGYLEKSEKITNKINEIDVDDIDDLEGIENTEDYETLYLEAKMEDYEKQIKLNELCVDKLTLGTVQNPFDKSEKWYPQFEYYRTQSLIKYNNEIERLYEKMEELSNKIDNLR